MLVSIFNDVIGPVMRGPSSSHCAAALRIGRIARDLMGGDVREVLLECDRNGSLPTTHEGQGSDMGLCGGLMGWDAADERLPKSVEVLRGLGISFRVEIVDTGDPHPNTYRLTLSNDRERHTLIALSTGGGMMEVIEIDGTRVSLFGDCEVMFAGRRLNPVLPVLSRPDMRVPFSSTEELVAYDAGREVPLWRYAIEYEMARGGITEREVLDKMIEIVRLLRRSIAQGIAGTEYADRMLGHQSGRFQDRLRAGRLLDGGVLNQSVLYVTALMEVKSAMGVIVAAPTAGACAALPGSCIAVAELMDKSEEDMARAMLAAGLIGVFITTRWTFAAEVGGCQAEGGSAAAMAAAALVTLADGTLSQSLAASSLALQSMLGLICDPVAGRVEAPCLGKNVIAASNAISCANMALADFDPLIPFDEVVDAAKNVAERMPREHRCTSLGGLAATKTARAIEARLAGCAAGCGCH